jgi:hypothetical protein
MKSNLLQLEDHKATISSKRAPLAVLIILFLLCLFLLLLPIAVSLGNILLGNGFHFGYLIVCLLCWLVGYRLLKVLLWNMAGKEIISFNGDQLHYVAHYKYFTDGKVEIPLPSLTFERLPGHSEKENLKRIKISAPEAQIESVLELSILEVDKIEKWIKSHPSILEASSIAANNP